MEIRKVNTLTKLKVLQIGIFLSFIGFVTYQVSPYFGINDIKSSSISNLILITIVLIWVSSYLFRVVNGNMTFMEQRKRYRDIYEKKFTEKLENKFESLSNEEKIRLIDECEDK